MASSSPPKILTVSREQPSVVGDVNPTDVSRYVADICGELSKMTRSARLMMLSYLLAMARQEAERIAREAPSAE